MIDEKLKRYPVPSTTSPNPLNLKNKQTNKHMPPIKPKCLIINLTF